MEIQYIRLEYNPKQLYKFHFADLDEPLNQFGWKVLMNEISVDNAEEFINHAITNLKLKSSITVDDYNKDEIIWSHEDLKKELHKFIESSITT